MKPKNKFQKEIVRRSRKLPKITNRQRQWGIDHCIPGHYTYHYSKAVCLDCGHTWKQKERIKKQQLCPNCWKLLERNDWHSFSEYYTIYTTYNNFQVIRVFHITKYLRKKEEPGYYVHEVVQHWIRSDGKYEVLMAEATGMSMYYDQWRWGSELEPRTGGSQGHQMRKRIIGYKTYIRKRFIPELRRNGFKNNFYDLWPYFFFTKLLSDHKFETLLKNRLYGLLSKYDTYEERIAKYWPSIKLMMKYNFKPKDYVLYFDYLNDLEYFDKDLNSPKYLFDPDWEKKHTAYSEKRRSEREREWERQRLEDALKNEDIYIKQKEKFFNLEFVDKNIKISTLKSIAEFFKEAKVHRHCVSGYYDKEKSLIMSAQSLEGERIETIEISLDNFKILQARGLQNKPTEKHDKIIQLVEENINQIKQAANA